MDYAIKNITDARYKKADGTGYANEQPGYHLEWWYDRSLKLWTVYTADAEDNQVGPAAYGPRCAMPAIMQSRLEAIAAGGGIGMEYVD